MKFLLIISFLPIGAFSQNITKDTVMSGTYDASGKVMHISGKISGFVTIKNAIIEANPYIQIFDTTVTLQNCKTREFSTAWYGASNKIPDNSASLQKCINTCISNNITNLYCADSYVYSKTLHACNIVGGRYVGFGLNFYGDGDQWNQRQVLTYTGNVLAYGVQVAKGGCFRGISLHGTNAGSGICVDYDATGYMSGSTGFFIENCYVGNFDINYNISATGMPANGDIIHLNNIHSGKCRVAFRSSQSQNKGNEINGFYSWDSCGIAIQLINGNLIVRGGDIANYCGQLLDVNISGWNSFSIQGLFAERMYSLGNVYAANSVYLPPVNLQDMSIRFIPGTQTLFTTNSPKVRISNSALWFYTGQCCLPMNFSGPVLWDNNDCGNCEIIDTQIQYIVPTNKLNPITFSP